MRGRIATFHRDQGFGFITPKVGVGDVFFHLSESSYRYPQAGDLVEYQQGPARDGGRISRDASAARSERGPRRK